MSVPLPICVVGCGSIGLRHAQVAMQSEAVTLTCVVEPDDARRAELAAMGLPAVADAGAAPAETRAAVIATPTPDHRQSGLAALSRGWAVLMEKPVAGSLADSDALIDAAACAGVPLFTGHHRRCHPFSIAARECLSRIGRLVAVQCLWSVRKHDSYYYPAWRRASGAGPIMTNLSHEIDLLRFIAGEIVQVSSLTSNARRGLAIEDTAAIAMRFGDGALGTVTLSDAGASPWSFEGATAENPAIAPSGEDAMRFIGEAGALSFPSLTLWQGADGAPDWRKPLHPSKNEIFARIDPILAQMERFAASVGGSADPVLATGEDGRQTLALTLASVLSAQVGHPVRADEVPDVFCGILEEERT